MTTSGNEPVRSALMESLQQGRLLLEALTDAAYRRKVPEVFDASIGGHYRHCLEHFQALLSSGCQVDYDARERDESIETDRERALQRTSALLERFEELDPELLAEKVEVRCKVSYLGDHSPLVESTRGREAVYSIVHAVHHYALISVICRLRGIHLPRGFGVAPSTAKHMRDLGEAGDARVEIHLQG